MGCRTAVATEYSTRNCHRDTTEASCRWTGTLGQLDERGGVADYYDWCTVPDKGYDAILFAGVALIAGCILQGKYSALWVLIAGEQLARV